MTLDPKKVDANSEKSGSQSQKSRLLMVGLATFVVLLTAGFLLPVNEYRQTLLEWIQGVGFWGPVVVIVFYVFSCVFFLPGSIVTLGAGFLFKLLLGTITVSIGSTLGACAAFLVGRTFARDWIAEKVSGNAKFAAIDQAVGREGFKIVLLTRLSPVFPFNLLNYAFGLTKVSFWHYALASWIGMLPGTVMYVYFGSGLRSLADAAAGGVEGGLAQTIFFWLGLGVTIFVTVFVTHVARNALREAVSESRDSSSGQ
ncbi:MAG: TVP38/TMEM64 family protein [bacterium]